MYGNVRVRMYGSENVRVSPHIVATRILIATELDLGVPDTL